MIRKNSKFGGFAPTAKTPKSEGLRTLKNIITCSKYLIRYFISYAKTPNLEGLPTPQKLKIGGFAYFKKCY